MSTMTSEATWNEIFEAASKGDDTLAFDEMGRRYEDEYQPTPMERMAFGQLIALADVSKDLVQMSIQIEGDMERVRKAIANGYSVNQLGELQSRGPRFDALCALRHERASHCKSLLRTLQD